MITYDRGLSMSAWIKTDMSGTGTILAANSGNYLYGQLPVSNERKGWQIRYRQ